jgi:hypothetical protein
MRKKPAVAIYSPVICKIKYLFRAWRIARVSTVSTVDQARTRANMPLYDSIESTCDTARLEALVTKVSLHYQC